VTYLLRRLVRALSTLLGTTLILFLLVRVIPADPAVSIAGPKADPQTLAKIRADLGLDDPILLQYGRYVAQVARGDLGRSYVTERRVADVIAERIPPTALLAVTSVALAVALGLLIGIATAVRVGSYTDAAVLVFTLIGLSLPTFWIGNVLIYLCSARWRLLPSGGYGTWQHLLLPAATLVFVKTLLYARLVHANVGDTLRRDFIRTARAKGVSRSRLFIRHALRNALLPIVTVVGLDAAELMSGLVLTETVFNWPGLGRLAVQAVFGLDIPLMAGTVLFSAALVLLGNLLVDLLYGLIDPRVQRA
jgi:peptide/nickel transport system permease protein